MIRSLQRPVLACLFPFAICVAICGSPHAANAQTRDEFANQRAALWRALEESLPAEYNPIDVYAENHSLTAVLFRSKNVTLEFSLDTGKVDVIMHMKELDRINRITYENASSDGIWVLWHNGQRELTIGTGK
jgi:hypothetical protein